MTPTTISSRSLLRSARESGGGVGSQQSAHTSFRFRVWCFGFAWHKGHGFPRCTVDLTEHSLLICYEPSGFGHDLNVSNKIFVVWTLALLLNF